HLKRLKYYSSISKSRSTPQELLLIGMNAAFYSDWKALGRRTAYSLTVLSFAAICGLGFVSCRSSKQTAANQKPKNTVRDSSISAHDSTFTKDSTLSARDT